MIIILKNHLLCNLIYFLHFFKTNTLKLLILCKLKNIVKNSKYYKITLFHGFKNL